MTASFHSTPSTAIGDAEVSARAGLRRFTVAYTTRIVQEAAQYRTPGEISSLLRREGLYSSHLTIWRQLAHAGARQERAQPRGPEPHAHADRSELAWLQRDNAQLREQLARAELANRANVGDRKEGRIDRQNKLPVDSEPAGERKSFYFPRNEITTNLSHHSDAEAETSFRLGGATSNVPNSLMHSKITTISTDVNLLTETTR